MLRIDIDGYLSQQVFEPSLIAKYSANPLLFWENNDVHQGFFCKETGAGTKY